MMKRADTAIPVHEFIAERWSPRSFDPTHELEAEQALALMEAARWAPSAMNLQPWRFAIAYRGTPEFDRFVTTLAPGNNVWATLDKVRDRVPDMVLIHGGDTKGVDRLASSWAERRGIPQVTFSLDMRLGARAGFKRNERMLSLDPRYVVAFPGNGVLERLVIEAKARRITVVDRRGPLGTSPKAPPG